MARGDVATTFLRWAWMRALSFRGYWIVTSLYLVIDADLSAFQLVFLGTAMELTVLVSEIPTGVMADTISRKWSIVISHVLMGAGMLITGLVTAFPALVLAQMLWGFGWTFSSGADVAWVTDELDDPLRIDQVLTARARWQQFGAAVGMVGFGALAWTSSLSTAIVVAGSMMVLLGGYVVVRFTEHEFEPTREHRWEESKSIFRRGLSLARNDHEIMLVFTATILINSGAEAFDRLYPKRLVDLGFPDEPDPIVWFTVLGVVTLAVGALALRIVEARIHGVGVARRVYAATCFDRCARADRVGACPQRRGRDGRSAAGRWCGVDGDSCGQRDLGQPAGDQRRARHRAVVPRSGRIDGRDHGWPGVGRAGAGDLDHGRSHLFGRHGRRAPGWS